MQSVLTNQSNLFTAFKNNGALTASASRSIIECCCNCQNCHTKHPPISQRGKNNKGNNPTCKAKAEVATFSPLLPRTGHNMDTQSNNTNSKYGKVLIDLNHGADSKQTTVQKTYQSRGAGNYGAFDKKTSTKSTISTESYNTQGPKKINPYEVLFEKRHIAKSKELAA
jgi:hypothetical protein